MYNSDGYVMIDMSDVDLTRSSQNIPGIYKRVLEVIDTNKLALIVNAGNNTPMAAVVHKKLNYYKITTLLYIFTINTNDIVIVEESGEATVDVEIVPTLTSGTKIADFSIGSIEGELYAPTQQSEINDSVTAVNSTWSSTKINNELAAKADTSDVYTKAQVDTALSGKADTSAIPTKTSELTNDSGFITSAQVPTIDDNVVSSSSVWSSYKTSAELGNKANSADVYTKSEVDTALSGKANSADVYTKTEVDTALANKANSADVYTKTEVDTALATIDGKIDYLRSRFYLGNYTSFTITLPDIRQGGDNFNHMTMIIGNNAFAILCCSYGQNTVSVVSLGSNTITATKSANSFNITVNLQDTSWGGIRVITLD